ncbi:MAG: hypothetical protein ACI8QH_000667 [Flammeovirgaceae bacterium]|jgi:hypothetical protein
MKKGIALIFGLALIATGCEQTNFDNEIVTIDSLMVRLDTLDLMHKKVDTTDFSKLSQKFTENISFVQAAYTSSKDTMPQDVALLMSDYRMLKKPSKGLKDNYQRTLEEINFSKNQLTDLKHDLQNNLLDSILVQDMLTDERKALGVVENSVQDLKLSSEFTRTKRAELEPRIDSLIQALKKDQS